MGCRAYCHGCRVHLLFPFVVLLVALAASCAAQSLPHSTVIMKQMVKVDPSGSADATLTITFSPKDAYHDLRKQYPNLYVLFRDLNSERADFEVEPNTLHIEADDVARAINITARVIGFAACVRDRWTFELLTGEEVVMQDGSKVFTAIVMTPLPMATVVAVSSYSLPPDASDVRAEPGKLSYRLPHTRATTGKPTVDVKVKAKERIMSALYKLYGNPSLGEGAYWVAKTIVRNTGQEPMYDLRITYRLGEYSDVHVPEQYSMVSPGGAVVDVYYPMILSKVTQIKTETPAQLLVKVQYSDPDGQKHEQEFAERIGILGINQFLTSNLRTEERVGGWMDAYNNSPLLAAYVTRVDDAVKQFAGCVSDLAGGVAAAASDQEAMKWLEAAYNMQLYNDIVYQTPSGFWTEAHGLVQEVKYPRDVFRDKAGTCVDLAITFAALAETVGIKTALMVIPGHVFCVVELPSGMLQPVENTGLGGGATRMNFAQACNVGWANFQDALQNKPFYLVDVRAQLEAGLPNPELPPVSANFLQECGIRRLTPMAGPMVGPGPRPAQLGPAIPAGPATTERWDTWTDPEQGAFTVQVPAGWQTAGGMFRVTEREHRMRINCTAPDSSVFVVAGDDRLPVYVPITPEMANAGIREGHAVDLGDGTQGEARKLMSGQEFAVWYAQAKLGEHCGEFQWINPRDLPDAAQILNQALPPGPQVQRSVGDTAFTCRIAGRNARGYCLCVTELIQGPQPRWRAAQVFGFIAVEGSEETGKTVLDRVANTVQLREQWGGANTGAMQEMVTDIGQMVTRSLIGLKWTG